MNFKKLETKRINQSTTRIEANIEGPPDAIIAILKAIEEENKKCPKLESE